MGTLGVNGLALLSTFVTVSCVGDMSALDDSDAQASEETSVTSQANTAQGLVAGSGAVNDDFNDEGVVDFNSHNQSNAAGLWQAILWADGAIETNGTTFDASDIDCDFGPNTTAATRSWQATHGLAVDGSAGPITFGRAGANLRLGVATEPGTDQFFVDYVGSNHSFRMVRNGVQNVTPGFQNAYFTLASFMFLTYSPNRSCSSSDFL